MKTLSLVICALCICCGQTLGAEKIPEDAQNAIAIDADAGTNTTYAHWTFDKSLATLYNETEQEEARRNGNTTSPESRKLHIAFTVDYFPGYIERKRQRQYEMLSEAKKTALLSLERCADASDGMQSLECSSALGEIYLYGNFSVPQVPNKAVHYLEKASKHALGVDEEANAKISHAHYLLGFVYSTGLFGELPVEQGKALLHYNIAADEGDIHAAMCLGYRYFSGKSVKKDEGMAFYYYSRVARWSYDILRGVGRERKKINSEEVKNEMENEMKNEMEKEEIKNEIKNEMEKKEIKNDIKKEIKNEKSINEDTKTKNTINGNEKKENKYINTDTDELHSKTNKNINLQNAYDDWVLAPNTESFAMHLSDFSDGMYGKWASETNPKPAAMGTGSGAGMYSGQQQEQQQAAAGIGYAGNGFEFFADGEDDPKMQRISELYSRYRSYYKGGMLSRPRNYTRAFENAKECARESLQLPLVRYVLGGQPGEGGPEIEVAWKCTYAVGHMLLRGEGVSQDFVRARKWLRTAWALCGRRDAGVGADLGLLYQYGLGMSETGADVVRAQKIYQTFAAGAATPAIEYQWGRLLARGGDPVAGWRLVTLAGYQGYLPALWAVVDAYESGNAPGVDAALALRYAKRFCESAEALVTDLRWAFRAITHGDNTGALMAYGQAAEEGFESAQASVAYMLYPSTAHFDTPPDVPPGRFLAAADLYRESARQGNLDSLVFLGDLHARGLRASSGNVSASPDRAVSLYREAAGKGSHQASYNLGLAYESGLGVPLDLYLAKRYYDKALRLLPDAYLPVQLALFRLRLKLWWFRCTGVDSGSSQEQEGLPRRTWHELLGLYRRLRQHQVSFSEINVGVDGALRGGEGRENLGENLGGELAANVGENLGDQLGDEDVVGKEDLIFSGIFLAFITFTIVARWRAQRRRNGENRVGDGNENRNENGNGNGNENGNPNPNPNPNPPAFQFNFMVIPL